MSKRQSFLVAVAAFLVALTFIPSYAQERDAAENASASAFDESLLNLPEDRDAAFYRDAFESLTSRAHDVLHTAQSFPTLVRDIAPFAAPVKVAFEKLAPSSEPEDVASCEKAFDLYIIILVLNEQTDQLDEFLASDSVVNHAKLKSKARRIRSGGEQMRTRFKITLGMLTPFDYACKREDKEAIRNFSVLIVEQSETVDWLVDELIYVLSHVSHHDAKLYAELRDSIIVKFSAAQDEARRNFAERLAKIRDADEKADAGKKRFQELQGAELVLEGLLLDTSELDWAKYRGKITVVALGAFQFEHFEPTFPKLLQLYSRYHDSGFDVILYCADKDLDGVKDFQEEVQLPWSIVCKQRNDDCKEAGGKEYRNPFVYYDLPMAIFKPHFILVDRDGKVISSKLQIDRLETVLTKELHEFKEPSQETLDASQKALDALYKRMCKPYEDAMAKNPKDAEALHHLAHVNEDFGFKQKAFEQTQQALELAPKDPEILNCLAFQLATAPDDDARNGELALEYAQRAAHATGYESFYILDTLAAAYAEVGDFQNATKWAKEALRLATVEGLDWDELQSYQNAVKLYNQKRPRREK